MTEAVLEYPVPVSVNSSWIVLLSQARAEFPNCKGRGPSEDWNGVSKSQCTWSSSGAPADPTDWSHRTCSWSAGRSVLLLLLERQADPT